MKLFIFTLLIIFNIFYSINCLPVNLDSNDIPIIIKPDSEFYYPKSNSKHNYNDLNVVHLLNSKDESKVRNVRSTDDQEHENRIVSRPSRHLDEWLRRLRNRYVNNPNSIGLFRNGGLSNLINSLNLPRIRLTTNGLNSNYHRFNRPNHESDNYYDSEYYQPANNNFGTSNRINQPASNYFVPSSTASTPFVEENNFVTPPNRETAVVSSAAPIIETNDDWVENSE